MARKLSPADYDVDFWKIWEENPKVGKVKVHRNGLCLTNYLCFYRSWKDILLP